MRPLPDLNDSAAMVRRGQRSAIAAARKDAAETLRDAHTLMQSRDWQDLETHARIALAAAERLVTLAVMWRELTEPAPSAPAPASDLGDIEF